MSAPKTPRKPKPSRDPSSGQFDEASPLTDPNLLAFALRTLRAIQDLEPLLADGARHAGEGAKMYAVAGLTLSLIKDSVLRELEADPEAYKEAKKKRLDAVALGNVPPAGAKPRHGYGEVLAGFVRWSGPHCYRR